MTSMFDSADPLVRHDESIWSTEICGTLAVAFKIYRPTAQRRMHNIFAGCSLHALIATLSVSLTKAGLGPLGALRFQAPATLEERGPLPADHLGMAEALGGGLASATCNLATATVQAYCSFHESFALFPPKRPGLRTLLGAASWPLFFVLPLGAVRLLQGPGRGATRSLLLLLFAPLLSTGVH